MNPTRLLLLLSLLFPCLAHAGRIEGHISDQEGNALAFVSIGVRGQSIGTISNENGEYALDVPEGRHTLEYRYLGYRTEFRETGGQPVERIDVTLQLQVNQLMEVTLDGNENPANPIMRKVIASRKAYNFESGDFSCNVYIKGLQRAHDLPDRLFGQDIPREELGVDSNGNGILYLFESINTLQHRKNRYQEQVLSSKVSGQNNAFSYVRASDLIMNFNDNLVPCVGMERGLVSPIGDRGFFYYRYELEGSYYEGERKFYRIRVLPRRESDPVATGVLIVEDSLYCINALDLSVYRKNQLELLDSLEIHAEYQFFDGQYRISRSRYEFGLRVFNIGVSGYFFTQYQHYNASGKTQTDHKPKRLEALYIHPRANQQDSTYWDSIRPVPLTPVEIEDYRVKDSIERVRDSIPVRRTNGPIHTLLWQSRYWESNKGKQSTELRSIIQSVQFNSVEGLVLEPRIRFTTWDKEQKQRRGVSELYLRYGFGNSRLQVKSESEGYFGRYKQFTVTTGFGYYVKPLNGEQAISPLLNSLYTLFSGQNFLKLYQARYFHSGFGWKPVNGLEIKSDLLLERRSPLSNSNTFTFFEQNDRLSKNEVWEDFGANSFVEHQALIWSVDLRYRPFSRYIQGPDSRIDLGSRWPLLTASYNQSLRTGDNREPLFSKLKLGMRYGLDLGILGHSSLAVEYGHFFNGDRVYFMDYFHYSVNKTFYQNNGNRMLRLQTLDYFRWSEKRNYIQLHWEHGFNRFLINKIPGVKRIRGNEFIGFQYLKSHSLPWHYEISVGVRNVALYKKDPGLFRAEFIWGNNAVTGRNTALRIAYLF